MKKLFIIGAVLLGMLAGCSASSVTTTCTYTTDIGDKYTETFISSKNVVKESHLVVESNYEPELTAGDFTEEDIIDEYNRRKGEYSDITGFEYSYTVDGPLVTEKVIFDYEKMSFDDLVDLGYLDSSDIDYIALDMTIDNLEATGYVCK